MTYMRLAIRALRGLLLPASLALGTACGAGGANDPATAARAPTDWATQLLGSRPERTVVVRLPPNAIRDPAWKDEIDFRPGRRASRDDWMPLDWPDMRVLAACAEADLFYIRATSGGVDGTGIVVLHGVRAGLDPATAGFTPTSRASSGAQTYSSTSERDPTVRLFVLTPSTWIFANGAAATRLAAAPSSSTREPPELPALPDSIIDATAPIDEVATRLERARELGWIHDFDRVTAAGVVLYPPTPKGTPIAAKLVYPTGADARAAADDLETLIAHDSTHAIATGDHPVRVQAVGSTLLVTELLGGPPPDPPPAPPRPPPRAAPDSPLVSINGKAAVSMAGLRGKVVVVYFWGTWLSEADRTLPALQRLAEKYAAAGVEVVGIAEDDDPRAVLRYASDHAATFRLVLDADRSLDGAWAPAFTPAAFIVDRRGAIRGQVGFVHLDKALDDRTIEDVVKSLL